MSSQAKAIVLHHPSQLPSIRPATTLAGWWPRAAACGLGLTLLSGCIGPGINSRDLETVTEAPLRYPTAISKNRTESLTVAATPAVAAEAISPSDAPAAAQPSVATTPSAATPTAATPLATEAAKPIAITREQGPIPLAPRDRPGNLAHPAVAAQPATTDAQPGSTANEPPPVKLVNVPTDDMASPAVSPADLLAEMQIAQPASPHAPTSLDALINSLDAPPMLPAGLLASAGSDTHFPAPAQPAPAVESRVTSQYQPQGSVAQAMAIESNPATQTLTAEATPPGYVALAAASESAAVPTTLAQQQADLIAAVEGEVRRLRDAKADPAEIARLELQLRLLYLLAERPDEAIAAIEGLTAPERESLKHLMFGLAAFMADEPPTRVAHRNAKILRSLRDASTELAAGSRLDLKNMAFCEKVEYFGWYTEFPRAEFKPKQQVILYVEVENFAAEAKGPQAFETELQGSYQIFDPSGQIIAERTLPLDREVCRNYRRDYFLAYRIYLPDQIAPGAYRLELTVEDLKARGEFPGRKLGQATIDLQIRP